VRRHDYYALQTTMRGGLAAIDARHAAARADCETEMSALEDRELDAIDEIDWQLQQTVGGLTQRLNLSYSDEQAELAQALAQLRQNAIVEYLRQRRIDDANIQGIGSKLKERLAATGIVSAADVDLQRLRAVEGIGEAKAREIEDWAKIHRWQAEAIAPATLAPLVRGAILAKYQSLRDSIAGSRENAERKCIARREKITSESSARQDAVDKKSTLIDEQHDREYAAACQQFERDQKRVLAEFNQLWPAASAEREKYRVSRRKLETSLLSARGDLLRVQKQLNQLAALTFMRYLKRMTGMD
jgi:DNA-binding helix-hairpin-helix protein with protein kinase domain